MVQLDRKVVHAQHLSIPNVVPYARRLIDSASYLPSCSDMVLPQRQVLCPGSAGAKLASRDDLSRLRSDTRRHTSRSTMPPVRRLAADARVTAATATVRVYAPIPTIGIGYTDPRPWEQKWQDLLDAQRKVKTAYKGRQGNEDVRRTIEDFFNTCRELADWLWENTSIDESAVRGLIRRSPSLRLADAMAQTTKHHTRQSRRGDPITARITNFSSGPDGISVQIGWSRPSGASGSEEALDLARRCVKAWRRFLARNGLKP